MDTRSARVTRILRARWTRERAVLFMMGKILFWIFVAILLLALAISFPAVGIPMIVILVVYAFAKYLVVTS